VLIYNSPSRHSFLCFEGEIVSCKKKIKDSHDPNYVALYYYVNICFENLPKLMSFSNPLNSFRSPLSSEGIGYKA
jgi:hypothetical protein